MFAWSERNKDTAAAKLLRRPGHELQRVLGHPRAHRGPARGRARGDRRDRPGGAERVLSTAQRTRLGSEVFRLPVERIREGYYSDAYFTLTRDLLEADDHHPHVLMQVFQREDSLLGGIDEAIAVLASAPGAHAGRRPGSRAGTGSRSARCYEGEAIAPRETVMTIEGDYALFAHLETVYLGSLARRTLIMRNVHEVVEAARGKQIFYFPARHDHWLVQTGDGWAAHVAGAIGVSTDAQASWWGGRGMGTVPHGLIAAYGGDTVLAARKFADRYAEQMAVTVLVDFENDSMRTAIAVADDLGDRLWGVRLDTARHARRQRAVGGDGRLPADRRQRAPRAQGPRRARRRRSRARADRRVGRLHGRPHPRFEAEGVPVDAYGVGRR